MTKTATKSAGSVGAPVSGRMPANSPIRLYEKYLPKIQKRDGRIMPFQFDKVVSAISKARKPPISRNTTAVTALTMSGGTADR